MSKRSDIRKVVITGPESTGKTCLAEALAGVFGTSWVPEYARTYVEQLDRPYTFEDVEAIARYQIGEELSYTDGSKGEIIFFDTWLILTKVWFDVVYNRCPDWIIEHIRASDIDLFLVCDIDLEWVADPVRENGGEMRYKLLERYCAEIESFGFAYEMVRGKDADRLKHAMAQLLKHKIEP